MAFGFDKLKDDLFSMGKEVGDKVSDVSNLAKMKMDIRSKEDFLEKQYAQLGRMYYMAHKNDEESVPEQDVITAISEGEEELQALKQEVLNLQGAICCPGCGEKQQKGHKFCPNCGTELKFEEASEDEMFVDEEVEVEIVDAPAAPEEAASEEVKAEDNE